MQSFHAAGKKHASGTSGTQQLLLVPTLQAWVPYSQFLLVATMRQRCAD
eukprot:COSAG02_NODE_25054_length_670_cov_0.739054_1_plen_48_part_10